MMQKLWDAIWINAHTLATCDGAEPKVLQNAAIAVKDKKIAWVGTMAQLEAHKPGAEISELAQRVYDVSGCCVTPGLIDCHTHIVYGGNRANEFEARLQGVTYEEIARQGGGIQSSVNATRAASQEVLFETTLARAKALQASGVTTLEIKSGYGLDQDTELKMLRVAQRIGETLPLTVFKTYLGAHTVPKEFTTNPNLYLNLVCNEMIPRIAKENLAQAVDVFCEKIAFTLEQTRQVFQAAKANGLAIKCHAEQLSNSDAAGLAASFHALSADHLEYLTEPEVIAMAQAGTVAVLLPGAFYYLRETQMPPIALLRKHQVPIAVATDANPGTSPILSLLAILNMACVLYRLTPEEALLGVTHNAAAALGLSDCLGTLSVGKAADLAVWNVTYPRELCYYLGSQPLRALVKNGTEVAH